MENQSLIKTPILAKANPTIEEYIASKNKEDWAHASEPYTGKLVHFLLRNNVSKAFISQICWISFPWIERAHYKST